MHFANQATAAPDKRLMLLTQITRTQKEGYRNTNISSLDDTDSDLCSVLIISYSITTKAEAQREPTPLMRPICQGNNFSVICVSSNV